MQPAPNSLRSSISRREMLNRMGAGFGSLGLAAMLAQDSTALAAPAHNAAPLAPKIPHFAPKAKRVIQLFMPGGPSQVDTFDYKPEIARCSGQRPGPGKPQVTAKYEKRPDAIAFRFQAIWQVWQMGQ